MAAATPGLRLGIVIVGVAIVAGGGILYLTERPEERVPERLKSALPKDRGPSPPPVAASGSEIMVSLLRENGEDDSKAFTVLRVGGKEFVLGPYAWTGNRSVDVLLEQQRDREFGRVADRIRALRSACPDCIGAIETPGPTGANVPHSDVMRTLDAFLEAGIKEVNFVGAPAPRGPAGEAPAK